MNGAAAELDRRSSRAWRRMMMRMGNNHHFLLLRRKYQNSPRTEPSGRDEAVCSNLLTGLVAIFASSSELTEVVAHIGGRRLVHPVGGQAGPTPQAKDIPAREPEQ